MGWIEHPHRMSALRIFWSQSSPLWISPTCHNQGFMPIAKPQSSQPWRRHPAKWPHSFGVKNAQRRISVQVPTYCVAIRGPQLDFTGHVHAFLHTYHLFDLFVQLVTNLKIERPGAIPTKSSFTISENHHSALWTYEETRLLWSKQLPHWRQVCYGFFVAFIQTRLLCNSHWEPSRRSKLVHGLTDISPFSPTSCLLFLRLLVSATPLCIALGETLHFNHEGCIWVVGPHGLYKCHHHRFNMGIWSRNTVLLH